VLIYCIILDN